VARVAGDLRSVERWPRLDQRWPAHAGPSAAVKAAVKAVTKAAVKGAARRSACTVPP
jgi:hypothetical protein